MITRLLIVFIINILSNALGTLKTLFVVKNLPKPVYIITFIDAILFAYVFKSVNSENSFLFIISFALGKTVGAWVGNVIDNKLALGTLGVSIFAKPSKAFQIADCLRELGYSVTTYECYGMHGQRRFSIEIAIARKEFSLLKDILARYGYNHANMVISDVKKTTGKISINGSLEVN